MDIQLLLTLIAGHYLADYGLQTQFMNEIKPKIFIDPAAIHALTAHAAIHGLIIGLLSSSLTVGIVIFVTHWIIDFVRSSELVIDFFVKNNIIDKKRPRLFGIHLDQSLHIAVIVLVSWSLS